MIRWTHLLLSIAFLLLGQQSSGQTKDTIYVQGDTVILKRDTLMRNLLMLINLNNYVGRTVGELLQNDTIKMYQSRWWSTEPHGKLRSLNLTFARGLYIKIFPVETNGQPVQFSISSDFDFEAFKREIISMIFIDKNYFDENVVKKYGKKKQ
jgi:hypothetical protein